jgi:hypothetical protein
MWAMRIALFIVACVFLYAVRSAIVPMILATVVGCVLLGAVGLVIWWLYELYEVLR